MQPDRGTFEPAHEAIDELMRQTGRPEGEERTVYEGQLVVLGTDAKVTVYLPILAKRRARELLSRS